MIDLKLAKEIGATHFIDDVLCKFDYGKLHNYFEPCGFVPTTFTDKRLKELQPINFTELKEFRYTKSVQESLVKISKSCGKRFGIDVGYEDLPDVVESIINPEPEMVTEYMKVTDSIFDLRESLEAGELYFLWGGNYSKVNDEEELLYSYKVKRLYRKVEKPVDWKEVAREFILSCNELSFGDELGDIISNPNFNPEREEFIELIKRIYPLIK